MRIFEACIHSIAKSEETLENLRYFDTLEIVSSPAPATRPKASGELIAHFDRLLVQERQRLERLGFQARFALGAHAEDLPLRAHPELWRELESRVVQPEVVAVGALGLSSQSTPVEYAALQRQMAIANDHQLPCIVRLSRPDATWAHCDRFLAAPSARVCHYSSCSWRAYAGPSWSPSPGTKPATSRRPSKSSSRSIRRISRASLRPPY